MRSRERELGRFAASWLCVFLASCGANRHVVSPNAEELTHLVLVIRGSVDGQLTHVWHRAEEFNLSLCRQQSSAHGAERRIVFASARQRDCHGEYLECLRECMSRPLPRGYGHTTSGRGKGGKEEYCNRRCLPPYRDCMDLQGARPQEFSAADGAVDWLKRNRQALLAGGVVVIAGVVFVVVSAGAGLVVLAPAVLLASSDADSACQFAAVLP